MSCVESIGTGRARPIVKESFPAQGQAGYAAFLDVTIEHLPTETVLPAGLEITADSEEGKELEKAQFRLPHGASETKATLERKDEAGHSVTHLRVPVVPLPHEPGRKELTLPPLPVHVARASGQLDTLCTAPHLVTVEDPLASSTKLELEPDPAPRPQLEIWVAARDATLLALAVLPLLFALFLLARKFAPLLRKKHVGPPPPPPWEVALRALDALERDDLLRRGDHEAFLDRVADTLRTYLGDRYGAGGLEATTHETLRLLAEKAPLFEFERQVRAILQRADLVKFARRIPEESECRDAFAETKRIVQKTTPAPSLDPRTPRSTGPEAGGAS